MVTSRCIDWRHCIGTLEVVGGHGSMVNTCDIKVYYKVYRVQVMQGLHEGCVKEAMYFEKFQ